VAARSHRRPGQRPTGVETVSAKAAFIASFEQCGIVRTACQVAGISRTTAYHWLADDPTFRAEYHDAEAAFEDVLEAEVLRRAVHGVQEPVISLGKVVHDANGQPLMITRYSDTLLVKLLTARHRRYRRLAPRGDGSGPPDAAVGGAQQHTITLDLRTFSAEQLARLVALLESHPPNEAPLLPPVGA
jgi:hypothetical protein